VGVEDKYGLGPPRRRCSGNCEDSLKYGIVPLGPVTSAHYLCDAPLHGFPSIVSLEFISRKIVISLCPTLDWPVNTLCPHICAVSRHVDLGITIDASSHPFLLFLYPQSSSSCCMTQDSRTSSASFSPLFASARVLALSAVLVTTVHEY